MNKSSRDKIIKIDEDYLRAKYDLIFNNISDLIFIYFLDEDIKIPDKFIDVNYTACKVLGYKKEELLQLSFEDIISPVYLKDLPLRIDKLINEKYIKYETAFISKAGKKIISEVFDKIFELDSRIGVVSIARDITEQKKAEKKIIFYCFYDKLTGLFNRAYFEEELKRINTKRQLPLSIIIGDLNGLKLTNDAFGHKEGDKLLKKAAKLLRESCRIEDIICRWGGDEFAILLPRTTLKEAEIITERIKDLCAKVKNGKVPLSISLGVAIKIRREQDIQKILIEAEDNMYRQKFKESKKYSNSLIKSLLDDLSEKSHESREHLDRLRCLALKLGGAVKLPENEKGKLEMLATLHDIGKVAIFEGILEKKQLLNESEWRVLKKHPEIGYNIAKSTEQISSIAEAIMFHHEWWNGKGYPMGLREKNIPLISRIISIVDAFDSMTSHRPYKESISKDKAIEELKRYAGIQFDPMLVEKFINIVG